MAVESLEQAAARTEELLSELAQLCAAHLREALLYLFNSYERESRVLVALGKWIGMELTSISERKQACGRSSEIDRGKEKSGERVEPEMSTQPWNAERKPGNRRNIGRVEQSRKRNQQQRYRDDQARAVDHFMTPPSIPDKDGKDGGREQCSHENEGQEQQIISLPWRMLGTSESTQKTNFSTF